MATYDSANALLVQVAIIAVLAFAIMFMIAYVLMQVFAWIRARQYRPMDHSNLLEYSPAQ